MFEDARSLKEISGILGVPVKRLQSWADQEDDSRYTAKIDRSRKGKTRRYWVPAPELKEISRAFRKDLLEKTTVLRYSHGFVAGRDTRSNAREHRNQAVVWKVDIKSAFQSVSQAEIQDMLQSTYSKQLAEVFSGWVCRNGWLVPGNPAAPDIFNLYTVPMVAVLATAAKKRDLRFSVYADDCYFSGEEIGPGFRSFVVKWLAKWGFKAHEFGSSKNCLMVQGKDTVIITGLRLTPDGEIRLPLRVFGDATRLVKDLKSGKIPTEKFWAPLLGINAGVPTFDIDKLEKQANSVLGFLQYCYRNDEHFQAWAERQLADPEHGFLFTEITGKPAPKPPKTARSKVTPASQREPIKIKPKTSIQAGNVAQNPAKPIEEYDPPGASISEMLRIDDLTKVVGVSRSTIYRMERKGRFPQRVRLGENSVGWRLDEVQAWLANRPRGLT